MWQQFIWFSVENSRTNSDGLSKFMTETETAVWTNRKWDTSSRYASILISGISFIVSVTFDLGFGFDLTDYPQNQEKKQYECHGKDWGCLWQNIWAGGQE